MTLLLYTLSFFKTKPNEEDVYCAAESVIEHISFEVNAEEEFSRAELVEWLIDSPPPTMADPNPFRNLNGVR